MRPALAADAPAIAHIQVRSWRAAFRELLPATALDSMTGEAAREQYEQQWLQSVEQPPSSHHRVLTALARNTVTGFAAYGPSGDDDRWARTDAELYTLTVDPDHYHAGHGSRLLNATVDLLREDGYQTLSTWVFADDARYRGFLTSSGWAADGSRRGLDLDELAPDTVAEQVRMVTRLS
ncbi:MAG: GNAT family N-acetyltransferase [Streptosporangiales bacterium]|nr:GNAT family N-acetyltransferase [Streptosporangiales bacterium]